MYMETNSPVGPVPNLFIAGAPKCGTTSMYEYLRQHPQIFFPSNENDYWRAKEPNHLCPELDILENYSIRDRQDYLRLYSKSEAATWRGDASPYYLFSESAPDIIKQLSPSARILVMLRPPVAMMRSYHLDMLRIHLDDIVDFHDAINAASGSRKGSSIEQPERTPRYLDYFSISRFAPQVERYYRVFGRDAVKVVLLEDMVMTPGETYRDILEFLGIESSFRPDFHVYNETPGNGPIERLVTSVYKRSGVKRAVQLLVPHEARHRLLSSIRRKERKRTAPDPRDDQLRERCAADVEQLSTLIGRDLSHWHSRSG